MPTRTCNCVFNIDQTKKDQYIAVCEGLCRGLHIDADEALDLFTYDPKAEYPVVRIPALTVTKGRTIIAAAELRETAADNTAKRIMYRRSEDGGKNWSKAKDILAPEDVERFQDRIVHNPTFVSLDNGDLLFLFGLDYTDLWMARSSNEGKSFGLAVELTPALRPSLAQQEQTEGWKLIAAGPGHGIQLENGRILVPIWLSFDVREHRPSVSLVIASDDQGETWQAGEVIAPSASDEWINPSEGTLVQLGNGDVVLNFRHEGGEGYRLYTKSADGLTTWSTPEYHREMPDPVCHAGATRHPIEGWQAFINCSRKPMSQELKKHFPGQTADDRQQLALRFSIDEGKTWPRIINIAQDAGYSDLIWSYDGSSVYVLFEQGRVQGQGSLPNSLKFVQIHFDTSEL